MKNRELMEEYFINFLKTLKLEKNYSNLTILNYGKDLKLFNQFLKDEKISAWKVRFYLILVKNISHILMCKDGDEKLKKK